MGIIEILFFDTYAFFEILKGNLNYRPYSFGKAGVLTTKMNLLELHYGLLLKAGKMVADTWYDYYLPFTVDIDDEIIKQASLLMATTRKKRISYVDCIGYTIALSRNVPFLTGDKAFEGMPNVTFLK
ncbi:type II toxin-antitoxin system VapC family toxin [Candidatus Woesearchaeota archaeon]|nr:type II toxin-antitoxin system VapC family toxin [Candidatus Woesearchaeota archaeon]